MPSVFQDGSLVSDKVLRAEKRIAAYPYDTEAWSILIRDAQVGCMLVEILDLEQTDTWLEFLVLIQLLVQLRKHCFHQHNVHSISTSSLYVPSFYFIEGREFEPATLGCKAPNLPLSHRIITAHLTYILLLLLLLYIIATNC